MASRCQKRSNYLNNILTMMLFPKLTEVSVASNLSHSALQQNNLLRTFHAIPAWQAMINATRAKAQVKKQRA
jgi:hypothetical protein